ncbi:Flp pilus assembly protein CpaB [Yoonia sp. 2307UL14-13]|uniref:Flp pilus assembly protein CpaB n=1 Tax=Yoonia sp. 2307UL14-13 TaxID=3126506 RepID=UPI0030B48D10
MRAVFGLVLLIGMGLAGFAVYMVNGHLEQQERRVQLERQRAAAVVATVEIYAPTRKITYGEEITPDDVKLIKYATDYLPEGVFATEEELFPRGTDVLRVATLPMEVNEPILSSKVSEPGAPRGITALLSPGMRPFPLSDRMTAAYAGELRISDRVDVYWVGKIGRGPNISRRVKQRLEIISMDDADANGVGGSGVVLQVSEKDFQDLQLLNSAGSLTVTPVGQADTAVTSEIADSSLREILDIEVATPEVVVEQERCYRTERKGAQVTRFEVPCNETREGDESRRGN